MKLKALCFLPAIAIATTAHADDFEWKKMSFGAMGFNAPKYEGSSQYEPYYLPAIDLQYGPFFASVMQGAGVYLPMNESRSFIIAPAIRWRVKRNLGDPWGTIKFIENIRPTATVNTIYKLDTWSFNFRMTDGLDDSNRGAMFNLGISWQDDISDKINMTVYATAMYGDRDYNQTYFGITPDQSAQYGYDVYDAPAGLKSLDMGGLIKYFITDAVSIDLAWEFMRLVGPAAASPITESKNQILFGIGATYNF